MVHNVAAPDLKPSRGSALKGIGAIVGFLVCVEIASGALQGYYTPLFTDIARHLEIRDADVNWFEAAQLTVSALVVPVLARLGDVIGHRKVLLIATLVTAVASWAVAFAPNFWTFLIAWAFAGFYVVWLPLEVAIIHRRTDGDPKRTRMAAAVLVFALELSVIAAALTAGALAETLSMTALLSIPAVVVTLALPAIWFGVPEVPPARKASLDLGGFWLITLALALLMGGLIVVRLDGPTSPWALLLLVLAVGAFVLFGRFELRHREPLVDLRVLGAARQWPIQLTAFLLGVSVLGAQIPLSTFARTDPAVTGYGLGATAASVSSIIGLYVITLAIGALSLPTLARLLSPTGALTLGATLVGLGYLMFLPLHDGLSQLMLNMAVAGLGSGLLVAALPAAAAAEAPTEHTGFVTGMTNMTKTVGGALASSVFAIALSTTGSIDADAAENHASLGGYMTVWAICGASALLAAVVLALRGPRRLEATTPTG
ncbi:MFS transporter [Calidifontibacter indicus]|uniref:MFS transporter n=1 Tax=Calidifontibacter indicus TaxID=419650 RepID=A0A3D9UVB3_9MICO|nr:MFS transporter [Calidifontibacter indicus]REF30565.1 MFS transporter [Calidifontibacter indicus]